MTETTQTISPLRQRMFDDMRMRRLAPKTQISYVRCSVKRFAQFLKRPPDQATAEDLRQFQLFSVDQGMSAITWNATVTALKFFFEVTLERPDLLVKRSSTTCCSRSPPTHYRRCRRIHVTWVPVLVRPWYCTPGAQR